MKDLVYIGHGYKAEPYTTADIIAEFAGITHKATNQLVRQYEKDLELFGTVEFEMEACPHKTGASVRKIYHLTEPQATLFVTYLKNTPPVKAFKKELVQQFFAMRQELARRNNNRQTLKPASRSLADAINENTPPEHLHSWTFSNYFSLAHKIALGMSTTQLRKQRAIPAGKPVPDYLDSIELEAVRKAEAAIMTLLDVGMDYNQIKQALTQSRQSAA